MSKKVLVLLLFLSTLFSSAEVLRGYNINWSFLPSLDQKLLENAASLKPDLIRYPGGTVSKTWDWRSGRTSKRKKDTPHTLADLKKMASATGADVSFVLNMITDTLEGQIAMLETARSIGIPILYIEMGNEYYLGKGKNIDDSGKHRDNVRAFPTGKAYAAEVNRWAKRLRQKFPGVKIGITMLGRLPKKSPRQQCWNRDIVSQIDSGAYDAFIYHLYAHVRAAPTATASQQEKIIQERMALLKKAMVKNDNKEIWITEYGVHAPNENVTVQLTKKLADAIEAQADIALPQVLYTRSRRTFFSLLKPPNGSELTQLGEMFKRREADLHR